MRKLLLALLLTTSIPANAADNAVTMTLGSGITFRSVDVGSGIQSMMHIMGNSSGTAIYGTAGTANASVLSVQGIAGGTALPVSLSGTVAVTQSGTWTNTVTQATAASLNATVVGTGTFAVQAAATQSGTWTVQPGNTANTTAWLVTGTGGTFPITGTLTSITNPVTVAQATAANLNATVVGTGTFAVQAAVQGAPNITLTDCSGTIASGGTAQNAFAASAVRHGFIIQNINDTVADEEMWISFTTTAALRTQGSYALNPGTNSTSLVGGSFSSPLGMGSSGAVSIISATTGKKYSCTWW